MIRWLVGLSVRHHGIVAALVIVALVLGCWDASHALLDVFPEFVPSQVGIQTEAPGFTAQQVEELVTRPIENAVNGASGLATMRSESIAGLSVITITFNDGIDLHIARQGIAERLGELGSNLPSGVSSPKLSPLVSSTMDLLKVGLVSDKVDAYALRDAAEWTLKPRLLAVPGVAHAIIFGGATRQIHILPDLNKLTSYGLSIAEVADAARAALALRGAGFIDTSSQRVLLTAATPAPDTESLGNAVITTRNAAPILLRDVAEIKQAPALRFGDAVIMGKPGVLISLASQYGANTLSTTQAVERALSELTPALNAQGITVYSGLHRPANFIERALSNLERSLFIAALLILAVLYVFLRDVRAALIAFIAIPLSLLAAIAVFNRLGQTLNTMTLGGFAVALGVLVDDAIIDIENILRRIRLNATSEQPQLRLDIVRESSLEIRGPVVYATLVAIAAFLPALFTSSVQGHFVGPLALAFILAVIASLLVAMTATPALCALLLRERDAHEEARWLSTLKRWQARCIENVDYHFGTVAIVLATVVLMTIIMLPYLGGTFMPDFREGHFVVQVSSSIPGTSLEQMTRIGQRISSDILKLPYVQSVEQQVGRAELGEDTWGPHRSEFHVELKPDASVDQTQAQQALRDILAQYPGLQTEVVTFLGDRIGESLSGETAQVAIKVFGDDLDTLDQTGARIASVIGKIDGVADLQFKRQSQTPAISIQPSPAALAAAGVKTQDVLDTVQTAYAGTNVGETFAGVRTVDVVVLLPEAIRSQLNSLSHLMIAGAYGPVPLSQVAHLTADQSRFSIEHDGGQRRVSVTFNVSGRSLQSAVDEVRRTIAASVALPSGVFLQYTGAAEAEQRTRNELLLYSLLGLAAIVMVLLTAFKWRANAWLVLINLPFSLIGGVMLLAITGIGITLGSALGLVTVFGISARNSLLQLAHYEHLIEVEGASWTPQFITRGANERLIPIMMTAMMTALGLAPLALGFNQPGQEIEGPMAIVVLGGLLSSTLLNLVVLPVLVQRFVKRASQPHAAIS